MEFDVTFAGGLKVNAVIAGQEIRTDQPDEDGNATAPTPFNLFLASIGTCAGIYVLSFCKSHMLPTEGVKVTERVTYDPARKGVGRIELEIHVPDDFPQQYLKALERSADLCAVKKTILNPPEFVVRSVVDAPAAPV